MIGVVNYFFISNTISMFPSEHLTYSNNVFPLYTETA